MPRECANCGKPADKKCAGCAKLWYCGRECQEYHWIEHLFSCNLKREITTADHLALAVRKNLLPCDHPTLHDYGFARAFTADNQMKLLGLYIGLMEALKVKARTIHRWRIDGKLVQEIKTHFEALPPASRGSYYPWFLANQWVFDGNPLSAQERDQEVLRQGWIYSGGSPSSTSAQIKQGMAKWPKTKVTCLNMCGLMLLRFHPAPLDNLWVPFGFCTCDEISELELGGVYEGLMKECTFQELHEAFASSQLVKLFRSKGWGSHIAKFPFLEEVLAKSPASLSVWDLKQFIINEMEGSTILPLPAVSLDYGLLNCKSPEELVELVAAYRTFFTGPDADPPALHRACIEGKLFEYISSLVKVKNKKNLRRLMKNRYPLPNHRHV